MIRLLRLTLAVIIANVLVVTGWTYVRAYGGLWAAVKGFARQWMWMVFDVVPTTGAEQVAAWLIVAVAVVAGVGILVLVGWVRKVSVDDVRKSASDLRLRFKVARDMSDPPATARSYTSVYDRRGDEDDTPEDERREYRTLG